MRKVALSGVHRDEPGSGNVQGQHVRARRRLGPLDRFETSRLQGCDVSTIGASQPVPKNDPAICSGRPGAVFGGLYPWTSEIPHVKRLPRP